MAEDEAKILGLSPADYILGWWAYDHFFGRTAGGPPPQKTEKPAEETERRDERDPDRNR